MIRPRFVDVTNGLWPDQALDRRLDRVLSQIHPEFSGFRDFQRRALRAVVRGFDAFLVAPTSAGKTLVLEVLPYLLKGTVIVVLPLVALQSMMAKELALTKHLTVLCEWSTVPSHRPSRIITLSCAVLRRPYLANGLTPSPQLRLRCALSSWTRHTASSNGTFTFVLRCISF